MSDFEPQRSEVQEIIDLVGLVEPEEDRIAKIRDEILVRYPDLEAYKTDKIMSDMDSYVRPS